MHAILGDSCQNLFEERSMMNHAIEVRPAIISMPISFKTPWLLGWGLRLGTCELPAWAQLQLDRGIALLRDP